MNIDEDVYSAYEVEAFLGHHGVAGQRWGYRHPRTTKRGNYRLSTKQRVAVGATAVLLTPVGAAAVYAVLKSNGNARVSRLKLSDHKQETERLLAEHGSKTLSTQS